MPQDKKTVYLIDGSSYIHRAYHAIRGLANSKGFPTNAILGFTKMVLKLLTEKNPEYLAIVFDTKGPTFRHKIYEDYKANRPPMPEDMAVQLPALKEVVKNLGIKMFELQGFEADDIIGTWVRICEENGFRTVMVTGDKDFRQLITPATSMWDTMKDRVVDYESLKTDYGFEPEKFIDVMGLSGDRTDNIPGVPGVGEKTAITLIQEFGSFENVFDRVEEVKKKKLKENLKSFRDEAFLSKDLVTIDRFVPMNEDLEQLRLGQPSGNALATIFRELEFRGLWDQFASREEGSKDYRLCLSMKALAALAEQVVEAGILSIDTETTGQDPLRAGLVGISLCCEEAKATYLPLGHLYLGVPVQLEWSEVLPILKGILEDERILKIGQNIKYDAEVLKRHGVELKGINFDTMIASYVINPGIRQHNLDYLAQHYLNHKMVSYEEVAGKGKNARSFSEVEIEKACEYSCEDADITFRLSRILDQKMRAEENDKLFYDLEMKLLPVLMDMEMTGIKIDAGFFREMSVRFAQEMKEMEGEIFAEAGMEFNINSPQQLGYVLFEKLGLPSQKKTAKSGRYSTDVKVLKALSALAFKIPKLLLRYRTLSKLKSTYLDALVKIVDPSTGRVHTSYNQTVAATGRLSSSNPNLQNIPVRGEEGREIRKGFVAEAGQYLVSADYSQIELRVFAHYSEDEAFIEAFQQDRDIHTRTASEIMGADRQDVTPQMRRIAKAINFGIIYGMGPRKLSEELGIDQKIARDYIAAYYKRYQGVARYRDEMIQKASENGYVTTLFNRRRYLPDIQHANNRIRSEAERMAINTPIQGTAADLIKKAMINIHNRLGQGGFRSKMLLQVHDELVFEVPAEELEKVVPMIREEMEGVYPLKVPLKVDINKGRNWDEAH
ncbi:MAG: DNA polymerase I [Desulfobacteraceae bacterium]|nr:DNA polymerase I [Desulfobacterales bacterium]MBL6967347.1 DNA polymerase I [Desulfobacteraceae bacterium]MBL7101284.1 DNA polymerase I [Desulfobacteraceae bacterium]